ncbi:sigma factor-like helix-turn-helix DNA-binding protein [Nocardia brasiliensis]|uniref:sigma factor-like helix-turn-helix DNA-binding protein n=1 Tax=Nocardia brasiliensis TaxID=37326 RepID=UPI00366D2ACA
MANVPYVARTRWSRCVVLSRPSGGSSRAQVALTLRVVGGLSSEAIARACLVSTATVQQRIVRAKKTLAGPKCPSRCPTGTS